MPLIKLAILYVSVALAETSISADLGRERRIAEQIQATILDDEVVYLADGQHQFLGIYRRTTTQPRRGAVLLLHDKGANPAWSEVINPLRTGLTEHAWDTLSIQLPMAHPSANHREWLAVVDEAPPRITAAMNFLRQRQIQTTAIVAHGFGARMALSYLSNDPPQQILGLVTIGMQIPPDDPQDSNLLTLQRLQRPLLDLYGERDLPSVLASNHTKQLAVQTAGNEDYTQRKIAAADHAFRGQEGVLLTHVRAWLFRLWNAQNE